MQIRIEPEQLAEISSGLKERGEEFRSLVEQMKILIGKIPEAWAGQSAEAYVGQFEELQPGFNQVEELIQTIGIQIDQVVAAAQELDAEIAGKLQ